MNARELEQEQDELRRRRRRALEAGALACVAAAAALGVVSLSARLSIALAAGAGAEGALAMAVCYARRERIARLALDPAAYTIPEVDRYGRNCARERERLAASLADVVVEARIPGTLYLSDRVAHFGHDLELLAGELASSAVKVQPVSAVTCRRLLTHAVESPLYNPRVPPEELRAALQRIRGGIQVR